MRTRHLILQAAAEEFEDRGYLGTRLQDIVNPQDVSKGALYFHFPSKEALAVAVVQEHYDLWSAALTRLRVRHPRAIRLMLEWSWHIARLFRDDVMIRAAVRLEFERHLIGPSMPSPFAGWSAAIEELLNEAMAQGDLMPDVDVTTVADFIVAAFAGLQQASTAQSGCADLLQRVATMWRCVLPGVVTATCLAELASLVAGPGDDPCQLVEATDRREAGCGLLQVRWPNRRRGQSLSSAATVSR